MSHTPNAPALASQPGPELSDEMVERLIEHLPDGAGTVTTHAPYTGQVLADLPQASAADVADAYTRARAAQAAWAQLDPRERAKPFLRFHDLILARQAEILDVIQWETGKSRTHAFEEVADAAMVSLYYARNAACYLAPRRRKAALPGFTRTRELHHPLGVVGVIIPWNYPLALAITDITPALLAGNAVVHKPDTQTALTSLWARDLLVEAGLPTDLWQIMLGRPETVGDPLIDHADHIAFTGSTAAGRAIAERAGRRLIECSLELGGKNPMLVLADADLDKAAEGALRACFANAGQLCLSMERIYIHDSVYDDFAARLTARVKAIKLGAKIGFGPEMGSLTLPRHFERVGAHVADAVAKGARVLTGGKARPDLGPLFYEPTVLAGVTPEMTVYRQETFGPVVSLYRFTDEDQAVRLANDTAYGLNASIWSKDVARARAVAARIHAGVVNINEGYGSAYASHDAPMGGMKNSGMGPRRHGAEGLLKYTEAQTVASQHGMGFDIPPGIGQKHYARMLTSMLRNMKRTRIR